MDYLFLGNQLALDFVNTRPVVDGEEIELLPDFRALLRWFQRAGLLSAGEVAALQRKWRDAPELSRVLKNILGFRELLRREVVRLENGEFIQNETIAELNRLMTEHPMLTRVSGHGATRQLQTWFNPRQPQDLFAPLARSASELLTQADVARLRKCEVCVLHFLDVSKKGSRRWCSMNYCGNRAKVAAYAARQRAKR